MGFQPSTTIPGCTLVGGVVHAQGTIAINAFQSVATPAGSDQVVTIPDTYFYNPITGHTVDVELELQFAQVNADGTTTCTATSNTDVTIPDDFAFSYNGFHAAFLEVTTTAEITPPIVICSAYDDDDHDGFLDGTSPPVPEVALSFLHGEGGVFVDRTSSRDTVNNYICATVDHLSPFAVLVRETGLCSAPGNSCDDGDVCTVTDTCNGSLECVGSGAPDCNDGNVCSDDACVSPGGCVNSPALVMDCNSSNAKAALSIRDSDDDTKDQLGFQWQSGSIPLADFGDPTDGTGYTLCAFDDDEVLGSAVIPADVTCGDEDCWTTSTKGVKFADKTKPPQFDGVKQISGSASTVGKAKLQVKAGGASLAPLNIDSLNYPVTVQVSTSNAGCWEQEFSAADVKKNDGSQLKIGYKAP